MAALMSAQIRSACCGEIPCPTMMLWTVINALLMFAAPLRNGRKVGAAGKTLRASKPRQTSSKHGNRPEPEKIGRWFQPKHGARPVNKGSYVCWNQWNHKNRAFFRLAKFPPLFCPQPQTKQGYSRRTPPASNRAAVAFSIAARTGSTVSRAYIWVESVERWPRAAPMMCRLAPPMAAQLPRLRRKS